MEINFKVDSLLSFLRTTTSTLVKEGDVRM